MKRTHRSIAAVLIGVAVLRSFLLAPLLHNEMANNLNVANKDVASEEKVGTGCQQNYTYIPDINSDDHDRMAGNNTKSTDQLIPKVFYQTSKSRCMHPGMVEGVNSWRDPDKFPGYSYRFYDDEAMDNFLFDKERWEGIFPSLHLALQCVDEVHVPTMKADIWRYLILWEYGGLYVDIDAEPRLFSSVSIHPDDDGFFYVENSAGYLAQFFLTVSPHHPLMFYAVHAAVQGILEALDLSIIPVAKTTGPKALAAAMSSFMNNATAGRGIKEGTHIGEGGRSIRVDGIAKKYIRADYLGYRPRKYRIFKAMNMTHYQDNRNAIEVNKGKDLQMSCYNMMNATQTQTGFEYEGVVVDLLDIPPKLNTSEGS